MPKRKRRHGGISYDLYKKKKKKKEKQKIADELISPFQHHLFDPYIRYTLLPFLSLNDVVNVSKLTRYWNQFCQTEKSLWDTRCTFELSNTSFEDIPIYARGCVVSIDINVKNTPGWDHLLPTFYNIRHIRLKHCCLYAFTHEDVKRFFRDLPSYVSSIDIGRTDNDVPPLPPTVRGVSTKTDIPDRCWDYITALCTPSRIRWNKRQFPNLQFLHVRGMTWDNHNEESNIRFLILDNETIRIPPFVRKSLQHVRFAASTTSAALRSILFCDLLRPYSNLETIEILVDDHDAVTSEAFSRGMLPKLKRLHVVWKISDQQQPFVVMEGVDVVISTISNDGYSVNLDDAFGKGPLGTAKQCFLRYSNL